MEPKIINMHNPLPVVVNGESVKWWRNVTTTDCRQPVVVKVDTLKGLETFEGSGLDVGDVALGQVKLRQVLEPVERPRDDRLDRVAAER